MKYIVLFGGVLHVKDLCAKKFQNTFKIFYLSNFSFKIKICIFAP